MKRWANERRRLSAKSSAMPGMYRTATTPYVEEILDVLYDPTIPMVVCMKSSQIGWTDGIINNFIGYLIDVDPCSIIIMFAKEQAAKDYEREKFRPMIEVTDCLREKVDMSRGRAGGNTALFKEFAGGFLKLVGSNSPASVKSTPARVIVIEEPDDANSDVKGQGNTIKLLFDRTKTFARRKILYGGTPTIKGLSEMEAAYNRSDQRKLMVPCHDCGDSHVLSFEYLICPEDPDYNHPEYGQHRLEKTFYCCPHCGSQWNDNQRIANVRKAKWQKTADSATPGFFVNELYSPFPGSSHYDLAKKRLEAEIKAKNGDETDMIAFVNGSEGLPYAYKSEKIEVETLRARALDYAEKTVPRHGLVLTMGIDVQDNRVAVIIRAWGREEESWLVYWGELFAATACTDTADPVWTELDKLLFGVFPHAAGGHLTIAGAGIDSSDGGTNDAVYKYVRTRKARGAKIKAIKGESHKLDREIATPPKKLDMKNETKASKYGLQVYVVGTQKVKDLIFERLKLKGSGPGRMHCYTGVRSDYYDQVLSEVKAPGRSWNGRLAWQKKSGVPNEGLDCEGYALHQARILRLHLKKASDWDALERELLQQDLLQAPVTVISEPENPVTTPATTTTITQSSVQSNENPWSRMGQRAN